MNAPPAPADASAHPPGQEDNEAAPCAYAEKRDSSVAGYIAALKKSDKLGPYITYSTVLPEISPQLGETSRPWPRALREVLDALNITSFYTHQALAMDALRSGRHVVVATPTASGKSLIYTLPALENLLRDPEARALFLFPLKALAQDQLASFTAMTAHWPKDARPAAAVYDGDTSPHFRRKLRREPPQVLLTNPEMLHLALLPHHHLWTAFFAGLSLVVVDEVHTYRGLLGSHMALVFRRLSRIAALYGASPAFAFCSATVGNPAELAGQLTGTTPEAILNSGAPQGKRHYVFMNPLESPASVAIKLLRAALDRQLRTIVYCQSRRMTELISLWASEQTHPLAKRISAYRAGFLPEERRDIEARMASGELLAVVSTSALELGIDIGGLDLCILVGYPGTIMATLQRGGRVGRACRESAVILLAQEDALDQYIVRHAEGFFSRPPEKAVINPENPVLLERHLECAAAELPLRPGKGPDASWMTPAMLTSMANLETRGLLLRSASGDELMAARKRPQRHLSLRGSGNTVTIETPDGRLIGSVDGVRALREAHPGAIYLHLGRHFEITELDLASNRALARPFRPSWFTRTRGQKETAILSLDEARAFAGIPLQRGRLTITERITGYEKRSLRDKRLLSVVPLDLPPLVFETEGLWFQIPARIQAGIENARMHFMGAIHALEHAVIGMLPLQVMADRNDFGGISTPMHAQTGKATVFVYDGVPGGAGLSRAAFQMAEELFAQVRETIAGCPCDFGCPSCVHSPKCGSGNRPIDKEGALALLDAMLAQTRENTAEAEEALALPLSGLAQEPPEQTQATAPSVPRTQQTQSPPAAPCAPPEAPGAKPMQQQNRTSLFPKQDFVVLDVETRHSAAEVGGWHKSERMGVSVAVLYDSRTGAFSSYGQEDVPALAETLAKAPLVVGFNLLRFDYTVLGPHAPGFSFRSLPTLDMLLKVYEQLSYRISLDNLAKATLNCAKSADGLLALRWWKEQRLQEIEEYCRQDVALTRDLYLFGKEHGYLLFTNKAGQRVRVRADWA